MALVLRTVKGSKLTYGELDSNFTYLLDLVNSVSGVSGDVVKTVHQELASNQKNIARANIGAVDYRLNDLANNLTADERMALKYKLGIQDVDLGGFVKDPIYNSDTYTISMSVVDGVPFVVNLPIGELEADISSLRGLQLSADPANSMIYVKDANGVQLAELSIAFANNEGTTLVYNDTTKKIELRNDANELLSEIPVADFVSGIAKNAQWNGVVASKLDFKDVNGAVLFSVDFSMNNIAGLADALAGCLKSGDLVGYATQSWTTSQLDNKVSKSGDTMNGMLSFRKKGVYFEGFANDTGDFFIGGQVNAQWTKDFGKIHYESGRLEWAGRISASNAIEPNDVMTFGQFSGELNNIYDQLSAKANTRLGNVVSNLTELEKSAIRDKLGLQNFDGSTQFVVTTSNDQLITMTKKKAIVRVAPNHSAVRINAIQSAGVVLKVVANSSIVVKIPNVVSQLSNGTIVANGTEIALSTNQVALFEYLDESATFFVTKQSLIL